MAARTQYSPQKVDAVNPGAARASVESTAPGHATLQSWKEIASELNRGVRTVQRWERKLGLPVRRVGKGPRIPVFAFKDELHRWLRRNADANATHEVGLLQSVNDFFCARRSADIKESCDQCGSPRQFLKGHLWIYGARRKWSLSVPFCPVCDADTFECFCRSQIIQ
jgi:hypothetical protein